MTTPNVCCRCSTPKATTELIFSWSRAGGYACQCHGCARKRRAPARIQKKQSAAKKVRKTTRK